MNRYNERLAGTAIADFLSELCLVTSPKQECEEPVRQLKMKNRVYMPGFVCNSASLFHKTDLLVMAMQYEGLPAVILEAFAANCPVLTTDCFLATREIVEPLEGCFIIDSIIPNHIAQIGSLIWHRKQVRISAAVSSNLYETDFYTASNSPHLCPDVGDSGVCDTAWIICLSGRYYINGTYAGAALRWKSISPHL